jgi:FkbM family methyltransferase
MSATKKSLIGWMMDIYRNSRFHNAFVGAILAKGLDFFTAFKKKQVVYEINAIKFELDLREVIDSSLYYSGTFEPKIEDLIKKNLRPGMNVVDIGANIGYHTFRMASLVQPGGVVYAIEPTSTAYTKLLRNASLNPHIPNIEFIKIGLSKDDVGEQEIAFQSSYRLNGQNEVKNEQVKLMKLDSLVKERKIVHLDFIKLDVDGYEGKVLMGALETFNRFTPTLIVEITPSEIIKNGDDPSEIIQFLKGLGYAFFNEDGVLIPDLEEESSQLPIGFSVMVLAIPARFA